jgi:hypothetical protein
LPFIANLVDNAVKFTPEGGQVELSLAREGDEGVVRVRDTGPFVKPSRSEAAMGVSVTLTVEHQDTRKTVHFRSRPSFFRSTLVQFCNLISSRRNSGVADKLAI